MASTFLIQTIKLGKCFICLSMVVVLHVCFSNSHWFVDAKDVVFKATHSELNLDLQNHFHTVEISSLLPASEDESCNASPKGLLHSFYLYQFYIKFAISFFTLI